MTSKNGYVTLILYGVVFACSCHSNVKPKTTYDADFKNTERLVTETGEPELAMVAPAPPSVVLSCASPFTIRVANNLEVFDDTLMSRSTQIFAQNTNEMIQVLCGSDYYFGVSFVSCLQLDLPQSSYFIDTLLLSAFNMTTLPNILYGGCNATSELNKSLECIIRGVMNNPLSLKCLTDVESIFSKILNVTVPLETALEELCSVWGTMVTCISPQIGMCNTQLASLWMLYGRQILTTKCHQHAFPREVLNIPVTDDIVHDVFEAFNLDNSAISVCANQYSRSIKQFLPTSIINPAGFSNDTFNGITSVCGNQIEEFMFCIDEKRLNSTSAVDNFMFKIISASNMRIAYNKMCSQLEVLKLNVNCFLNSVIELQTCMCYMTDLIPKVVELTAQPKTFSFDQIVDPFCSFYVSFAKCYVSLLGTCSRELALLMQEVYLGALTPSCLGTTGASACSLPVQNPSDTASMLFQCGEKVAMFVSQETREANATMELDVMMTNMEELIVEAYNYTCSIGEEILDCLGGKLTVSQNPLDRLLLQMFNISKFASILKEGCNPSLLNDVKSRLEFILSMVLSDPRSSNCIESLNSFNAVLMGEVDVDSPNASHLYCGIWAEFSECIEAKLSCSSANLATKWRQFTIESLNSDCHRVALHQQAIDPIGPLCDRNGMDDSALSLCGMSFMASFMARENEDAERPLQDVVMDQIQYFCKNEMEDALLLIECLRTTLSSSAIKVDSVVTKIFNLRILEEIPSTICSLTKATKKHMGCIVGSMEAWKDTESCMDHLKEGFNVTEYQHKDMDELIHMGCRGWKDFSNCILPHINACDIDLSMVWSNLSHIVLTADCQTYIAQTARHNLPNSSEHHNYSALLTLFSVLISLMYYSK